MRLEGWLYLGLGGLIIAGLFWPTAESLIDKRQRVETARELIASHIEDLSAPAPTNEYLRFQSFVYQPPEGTDTQLSSSEIQTALIDQVRIHQARLVDLRVSDTPNQLDTLEALELRLEIEGDLKALLDTISALGDLPQPILIDSLTIKPVGRFDRPDRRLRLSLDLSVWSEVSKS